MTAMQTGSANRLGNGNRRTAPARHDAIFSKAYPLYAIFLLLDITKYSTKNVNIFTTAAASLEKLLQNTARPQGNSSRAHEIL
ncbi:hypothetical protein [Nioella nitratireducens]|uniref:hypothetical protein n=1 Tax=Nioella nitratireducens TaxID=1287720 RepID=UPI0011BA97C1|nr:hypothetical protein [Nioella nitratireducens]